MSNGVFSETDPTIKRSVNYGNIVIPEDVDRTSFTKRCFRLERFSILVEKGGGVLHDCFITKSALHDIKFPEEGENLGSAIVFLLDPYGGKAIIIGVINKDGDSESFEEYSYLLKRSFGGNYSLISVDGRGLINIDVIGKKKSKVNINVRSDDNSAEFNLKVKGTVNIIAEGDILVNALDSIINLDSEKVIHNKGDQPMVLGDILQSNLDKTNDIVKIIVDALKNWPVVAQDGGASLKSFFNSKLGISSVGDFSKIKSEQSFLK